MATTMTPPTAAPKPGSGRELRFVSVRANLLPDEIISDRQTDAVRRQVLLGLVVVVALLVGWFGLSWWQTSSSRSDLDDARHQTTALLNQQQEFGPLVQSQAEAATIQAHLQKLMTGDLSWKAMLTTLRSKAPAGVNLTTVTGNVVTSLPGGTPPTTTSLNQTGKQSVGTLIITGTAHDKRTVAAYADQLGKIKGLTAPLISSVTTAATSVTFTVNLIVTSDALGGRYAAAAVVPATGGH
jgi:Tfp pilus assembly protein PilN